jgi:hypothetical protein
MTEQPKRETSSMSVDDTEKAEKNEVQDDAEDGVQEAQVGTAKQQTKRSPTPSRPPCRRETLPFTPCP